MPDWITLSKLLPQLIYPENVVLWLMVLTFALLLFRRAKSAGIVLGLALIVVGIGSSPIATSLYQQHETQFQPVPLEKSPSTDAIVVLAGDVSIPVAPRVEVQVRGNRTIHAMRLYQAGKASQVIISGGNVFPQRGLESEAAYSGALLEELGIPKSVITVEGTSRNTRENAVAVARLLREKKLRSALLVTDALHMPRAVAVFQAVGVEVIPSPSSISASMEQPQILDWVPSMNGLGTLKSVLHEKIGILAYRARGWIE